MTLWLPGMMLHGSLMPLPPLIIAMFVLNTSPLSMHSVITFSGQTSTVSEHYQLTGNSLMFCLQYPNACSIPISAASSSTSKLLDKVNYIIMDNSVGSQASCDWLCVHVARREVQRSIHFVHFHSSRMA